MDGEAPAAEGQPQPDPALMENAAPDGGDPNAPAGGLVLGEDGLPVQVEENKAEEIIPEEILKDMTNIWNVFEMQTKHSTNVHGVEIKHLRTIMRALDFDLPPEELAIVEKQIDPEGSGQIRF